MFGQDRSVFGQDKSVLGNPAECTPILTRKPWTPAAACRDQWLLCGSLPFSFELRCAPLVRIRVYSAGTLVRIRVYWSGEEAIAGGMES